MPDFKTVHDSDKGAGSDITSEFYLGTTKVASDGTTTNVGVDSTQLASIISDRLGGVPEPSGSDLVITIGEKTFLFDVQTILDIYTHHK